jgi:hypothetical protein
MRSDSRGVSSEVMDGHTAAVRDRREGRGWRQEGTSDQSTVNGEHNEVRRDKCRVTSKI